MKEPPTMVSFGWSGEKDKEIKVELKGDTWYTVHFVEGQPDQSLTRVFGTNEIPSPWKSDSDKETVINELAVRNPNATVT